MSQNGNHDEERYFAERSAITMGEFIQVMVDGGNDQIIIRNVGESKPNLRGEFVYRFEVFIVPSSELFSVMKTLACDRVSDTLIKLMATGVGGPVQEAAFRKAYPEDTKDIPSRLVSEDLTKISPNNITHKLGDVFVGKN